MTDAAQFWDARADKYAKSAIRDVPSYEHTLERVAAHLGPDDRVLEVGCGTGTTALHLAPRVASLTASDVSGRMIEIAREKAAAQGVENVRFVQATADDSSFETGSFDVVMGFNYLHLVRDAEATVRRLRHLLRPGGLFISKTFCLAEQTRLWAVPLLAMRAVGLAPYVRLMTFADVETCIREAGFEIIETGRFPKWSRFVVARKA